MPSSHNKHSKTAVDKVMAAFNRLSGRTDDRFDKPRPAADRGGVRLVSVDQEKSLFRRCVEFDFDYLMGLKFVVSRESLQYLLPQSVLGRALHGHGGFIDDNGVALKFVDADFDRICSILESQTPQLSHLVVRGERNRQIERLHQHLLTHIDQPNFPLYDQHGPLFGIDFLKDRRVETRSFLQGLVLAGWMDSYGWRKRTLRALPETFRKTPLELGGGEIYVIDRERFRQTGLTDMGQRAVAAAEISSLVELGAIHPRRQVYQYPQYDQVYVRHAEGLGICDDLALLYIGRIYGPDAMLGGFLMDAVDSYDKFLLHFQPGGMDAFLAKTVQKRWREITGEALVTPTEIHRLIHFAAKRNTPTTLLSSSHRRFIQVEEGAKLPTILHHWNFLQGKPLSNIKLGFARVPAETFYQLAMERFYACGIYIESPRFQHAGELPGGRS